MKRVLSISGGGMRGVIPGRFLVEIEKRAGRKVHELFDLVAGTSTGSILAALMVSPKGVTGERAIRFYYEAGPHIFKRGWLDWGWAGAKYSSGDLAREVRACVGDFTCSSALKKAMIPAVDADAVEAEFIKTWCDEYRDMKLWESAVASSSAQTYFPAFRVGLNGRQRRFIDGGNHTNNPSASAMFEAFRLWPEEPLVVIHLGTGKQRNPKPLPDGGILRWAPLVFGTTSECQDDCANYYCRHAPGVTFRSVDVTMEKFPPMDDASRATLDRLVEMAEVSISSNSQDWDGLMSLLAT